MTLKTVTGPSIRDALGDARRLFGDDVVLLQSSPAAHGQPASVTVAFDTVPTRSVAPPPPRRTAPPALPDPMSSPSPRAYGYGAARNARPAPAEPISAPPPAPSATADEVAELRARLADLEAALAEVRAAAHAPDPPRAPLVFVGPGGSGKTSLVLRLAQSPALVDAACPAVLVVAPEADRFIDPAPTFWGAGVPVAVVHTPEDVREALQTFADADLLLIDTPSLPLQPERARPVVARLGAMLAPLAAAEVHLVVDATRSPSTLSADSVQALGLAPDALTLTRLDEASPESWRWGPHLDLPIRLTSAGPDVADVTAGPLHPPVAPEPAVPEPTVPEPASPAPPPSSRSIPRTPRPDSILQPVDLSALAPTAPSASPAAAVLA